MFLSYFPTFLSSYPMFLSSHVTLHFSCSSNGKMVLNRWEKQSIKRKTKLHLSLLAARLENIEVEVKYHSHMTRGGPGLFRSLLRSLDVQALCSTTLNRPHCWLVTTLYRSFQNMPLATPFDVSRNISESLRMVFQVFRDILTTLKPTEQGSGGRSRCGNFADIHDGVIIIYRIWTPQIYPINISSLSETVSLCA